MRLSFLFPATFVTTVVCLAAPAAAAPITVTFDGTVTQHLGFNQDLLFPELVVGVPFSALVTFNDATEGVPARFGIALSFGAQHASGWGHYSPTWFPTLPSMNFGTATNTFMLTDSGNSVAVSWMNFSLTEGWQSGSFDFYGEDVIAGTPDHPRSRDAVSNWSGSVESVRVPEPSTLGLCLLGVAGLLSRRRSAKR